MLAYFAVVTPAGTIRNMFTALLGSTLAAAGARGHEQPRACGNHHRDDGFLRADGQRAQHRFVE